MIFLSCTNEIVDDGNGSIKKITTIYGVNIEIPYATDEEISLIESVADNEHILSYKVARQYAFIEFMDCYKQFLSEQLTQQVENLLMSGDGLSLSLSDRPVVVYNYDDTPYYYEFAVLLNGSYVGSITVDAIPQGDEIIEFVNAAQYDFYSSQYKRYVGRYPNVFYNIDGIFYSVCDIDELEDGDIYMGLCEENISGTIEDDYIEMFYDKYYNEPNNDFSDLENDLLEMVEREVGGDEYFSNISSYYANILAQRDSDITKFNAMLMILLSDSISDTFELSHLQDSIVYANLETYGLSCKYFIPEYANQQLRYTRWKYYCGPAIMAWLYRGKWNYYNGVYLPLYGECGSTYFGVNQIICTSYYAYYPYTMRKIEEYRDVENLSAYLDGGLYNTWFSECVPTFDEYPLYHGGLNRGLQNATANVGTPYKIHFTLHPQEWIEDMHEPVVIECSPPPDYTPHYVGAIGIGYTLKSNGKKKHKYFLCMDNGYQIGLHNYYPYWRKHNCWNLHYAWKPE